MKNELSYIANNIIVSLDFDGVVGHGLEVKKKYAKEWFGVDLKLHQTKKEGFEDLMKSLGREEINYRSLMDKVAEEHTNEYKIIPGTKLALNSLYDQGFRFIIITSRNDHDYPYAKKFVEEEYGKLIKNIYNTKNKPKTEFAEKLKPRIHMDDDIVKLTELEMQPVEKLFYRQPENEHMNFSDYSNYEIKEIKNWSEFYLHCLNLKERDEAICWKYKIENKWNNIGLIHEIIAKENNLDELVKEYKFK